MTVTKQQQLEWLANKADSWGDDRTIGYMMSLDEVGFVVGLLTRLTGIELLAVHSHIITREEWQQERDKMQKQQEAVSVGDIYLSRKGFRFAVIDLAKSGSDCSIDMVVYVNLDATNDFPPGQNWVLDSRSFKSKFKIDGGSKQEVNNSWHERGELPPPETYCQFQKSGTEYGLVNCFVIGIDDLGFCVCRVDMDYHASMSASDFRPIRPEREKAIDDISSYFCDADGFQVTPHATDLIAARIYDAGYRKAKS